MSEAAILIRNARIVGMNGTWDEHAASDILVKGTRIAAIGGDLRHHPLARDAAVISADGMLAMPGLINAHVHSPANFMRGTLEGMPLELFMLYEVPPLTGTPPTKRMAYVRTMLGAMEMLRLGTTSVMDDAFYVPSPTAELIDGVMEAYRDSGQTVYNASRR